MAHVAAQQITPSTTALCGAGLPKLLQMQLAMSGALQQTCRLMPGNSSSTQQQPLVLQQQRAMASSSNSSSSNSSSSAAASERKRARGYPAYRARLPRVRKYGPALRDVDPAAFERMRLVVGYYDLPQNRTKPQPPPPSHVVINNLQALMFTPDVDPYYKLALLSYRSKLENTELVKSLAKTRSFLQQLSAPPDFLPAHLEALAAAPAAGQQQQQQPGTHAKATTE